MDGVNIYHSNKNQYVMNSNNNTSPFSNTDTQTFSRHEQSAQRNACWMTAFVVILVIALILFI